MIEKKKILITVKTYPLPSKKYLELVCTAGILEDGSFIRLYPIDYRYRKIYQWYKKYQWIEVEVEKNYKDSRKESYRPILDTIRIQGEPLDTKNGWAKRKDIVLKHPVLSMEELWEMQKKDNTSLGLVKPKEILDVIYEPDSEKWKAKWRADINQLNLFGPQRKPIEKIPYKFKYHFKCNDIRCRGHKMMIEDWEIGQLYRNEVQRLKNKENAAQGVRNKLLNMCSEKRDSYFFVGTVLKYGTWIIAGVFWPPRN